MTDQAVSQLQVNDDLPVILADSRSEDTWIVIIQSGNGLLELQMSLVGEHLSRVDAVLARPCTQTKLVERDGLIRLEMPYTPLMLSGKQAGHLLFNMRSQARQAKEHDFAGLLHNLALMVKNRQALNCFGISSVEEQPANRVPPPVTRTRPARQHGRATPGLVTGGFKPHQL